MSPTTSTAPTAATLASLAIDLAPTDHWVALPQGRIFARRWSPPPQSGAAAQPPIVLFHESLGSVELWRGFPATLCAATGRTVVAYDRLDRHLAAPQLCRLVTAKRPGPHYLPGAGAARGGG